MLHCTAEQDNPLQFVFFLTIRKQPGVEFMRFHLPLLKTIKNMFKKQTNVPVCLYFISRPTDESVVLFQ